MWGTLTSSSLLATAVSPAWSGLLLSSGCLGLPFTSVTSLLSLHPWGQLVGWRLWQEDAGTDRWRDHPFLSPPLASAGSPVSRVSLCMALSFQGAALRCLFRNVSLSWPPHPGDQLVRGSGSFKLLILFSRKLLTLWFKHFFLEIMTSFSWFCLLDHH